MSDPILEDLKQQIAARRVVLVVGSGISIAATQNAPAASWLNLLKLGVERCAALDKSLAGSWEERALADIASPQLDDLLAGASKVRRTLRRLNDWPRWLKDTVGSLTATRHELIDAIGDLDGSIVTTNYDDLLEKRLQRHPITWTDTSDLIEFARLESRDTILHLHGFWREPDSVILDVGDYERVIGDRLTQAGLQALSEVWSLVFIGCGEGLADPNFEQFLEWTATILRDARHRHFRLERAGDAAARQRFHADRDHMVRVVPYGESYDDLPSFLQGLRPARVPEAAASASDASTTVAQSRPVLSASQYIRLQEKGRTAVQQLVQLAKPLGWKSIAAHGAELSEILEQELYRVAITGRSRVGKSTLLNALIGRTICPSQRIVTTAIPIVIGPGEHESLTVTFERNYRQPLMIDGPITADMLAPYADQQHNKENVRRVEKIDVRLDHQVLDLGIEYVDIPGVDDATPQIEKAANEVIAKAHALVIVLDVSTYTRGGFLVDKATRQLLDNAGKRSCPVLIACNKTDGMSQADRNGVEAYLREQLESFGLWTVLAQPPFLLSALEATAAQGRGETLPRRFIAFEEALWAQLWNTESIGLRRLYRVFDALRTADEEASALIAVRRTKGPERELLQTALAQCQRDESRIRRSASSETDDVCGQARMGVDHCRTTHLAEVAKYVAALTGIPAVSDAIEALHPRLQATCQNVIEELTPSLVASHDRAYKAASRSLAKLREQAGLSSEARHVRDTVEELAGWTTNVPLPATGRGKRRVSIAAAGLTAGAAVGIVIGGPLAWLIGGGVALLAMFGVDQVTDTVNTLAELQARLEHHANDAITSFGTRVEGALVASGNALDNRIHRRMNPFLTDMRERLEEIREPTEEELRLHAEMHRTTKEAIEALAGVLGTEAPSAKKVPEGR